MENIHKIRENIYITNDEEIKEGDWMIRGNEQPIKVTKDFFWDFGVRYYKIILTTDQDLIKDGVQAIDDEFLEWFVKNPSCEEIEIVKDLFQVNQNNPVLKGSTALSEGYKIIIPKEKPNKTHYLDELPNMDREVLAKMWESAMPKLESKQETLEEAVERLIKLNRQDAFYEGAKWQQEQDKNKYSEEEVLDILRKIHSIEKTSKMDSWITKWFKQFKKN